MSALTEMIAMMDPGIHEDRKQTFGDVGPWPGRPNAQEFNWREVAPQGTDLVGGAATGGALAGLFNAGFAGVTWPQAMKFLDKLVKKQISNEYRDAPLSANERTAPIKQLHGELMNEAAPENQAFSRLFAELEPLQKVGLQIDRPRKDRLFNPPSYNPNEHIISLEVPKNVYNRFWHNFAHESGHAIASPHMADLGSTKHRAVAEGFADAFTRLAKSDPSTSGYTKLYGGMPSKWYGDLAVTDPSVHKGYWGGQSIGSSVVEQAMSGKKITAPEQIMDMLLGIAGR